jgi:hypothetical protein
LNLAPWNYRNILSSDGGPVARISSRELGDESILTGFESFTYLESKFKFGFENNYTFYGNADGCGFGKYKSESVYKSISESIERWAFYSLSNDRNVDHYGFHIDPTTTGMAAFPGLFQTQSRVTAYREAVERWAVSEWWEGRLPIRVITAYGSLDIYEVITPFLNDKTVIVHKTILENAKTFGCFGFATAETLSAAVNRASVELNRNIINLRHFLRQKKMPFDIYEKRLMYFAFDGLPHFHDQVLRSQKINSVLDRPKIIVDSVIRGEWSKFATVWRCLFEKKDGYNAEEVSYFLF